MCQGSTFGWFLSFLWHFFCCPPSSFSSLSPTVLHFNVGERRTFAKFSFSVGVVSPKNTRHSQNMAKPLPFTVYHRAGREMSMGHISCRKNLYLWHCCCISSEAIYPSVSPLPPPRSTHTSTAAAATAMRGGGEGRGQPLGIFPKGPPPFLPSPFQRPRQRRLRREEGGEEPPLPSRSQFRTAAGGTKWEKISACSSTNNAFFCRGFFPPLVHLRTPYFICSEPDPLGGESRARN